MKSISCDRCTNYTMEWKTLSIFNQTDGKYLNAREKRGRWVKKSTNSSYKSVKPEERTTIDLCIACFKIMEMAIADNVGQVFYEEVTRIEG